MTIVRSPSFSLFLFALASCSSTIETKPEKPNQPATSPIRAEQYPGNTSPTPVEGIIPVITNRHPLQLKTAPIAGTTLNYLSFDSRDYTLEVVDQPDLGSTYQSAAQVTKAKGALASINGGFFTPEGTPLGVLFTNGNQVGTLNTSSSLGSGVLYVDQNAIQPVIARRTIFQKWLNDSTFTPKEVLQSGPFLVENGSVVSGLSNKESRIRSLLLWDGNNHFAIAQCDPITLRNLGRALAKQPLPDFQIQDVLNLDGGRSADFNVTSKVSGGPLNLRRWWNKPIRNYLILKPQ